MKSPKNKFAKRSKALTFFIIFAAISAMAAVSTVLYKTSGTSSFKMVKDEAAGITTTTFVTQDYDLYRHYKTNSVDLYLVSSKAERSYYVEADGVNGSLSWDVRKGPKLQTKVWNKTEQATSLRVNHNLGFIVTALDGCCGAMPGYRFWNITNGKLLMSFNSFDETYPVEQPFSIEVPNSVLVPRFMGVISLDSTRDRDFTEPVPGKEAVALVKYANESLKQKFQIDMETADGFAPSILSVEMEKDPAIPNSGQIEINRKLQAVLWNVNGSVNPMDVSGVILKIVMSAGKGDKILRIPVRQDELKEDLAEVPPGVQLRSL